MLARSLTRAADRRGVTFGGLCLPAQSILSLTQFFGVSFGGVSLYLYRDLGLSLQCWHMFMLTWRVLALYLLLYLSIY